VLLLERKGNAVGAQEKRDEVTDLTLLRRREKPMLRTIGKTVGGALAMLCLVSTLAVADELTCMASDGKGNCMAALRPDGKVVVVVGEGVKVGEPMSCVDTGYMINCTVSPGK
jgi:hypothetical protein